MKMNVEFNSIEEIKGFINLFRSDVKSESLIGKDEKVVTVDVKELIGFKAPEKASKKPAETEKEETKPTTSKEEKKPEKESKQADKKEAEGEEEEIDKETVRAKFSQLIKAGKNGTVKALLTEFGAKKLGEVKPEDYKALNNKLIEIMKVN